MQAGLTVPATLDTHTLQSALENLANELMVDISFDAASHSGA
jgi:glycine cleavage system regulatory protein